MMDKEDIQGYDDFHCNCLHSLESAIECTCFDKDDDEMKFKEVLINILIGKEEEDLLKLMDKKELKELEEMIERCKPVLDALGKKETTDQDIWNFINLIEQNLINKIIINLEWVDNKMSQISRDVAVKRLIKKYKKMVK